MPPLGAALGNHLRAVALPVLGHCWHSPCAPQGRSGSAFRLGSKFFIASFKHQLGPKAAAQSEILFCGQAGSKGNKTTLVSLTDTSGSPCGTNWIQVPAQSCFPSSCCLKGSRFWYSQNIALVPLFCCLSHCALNSAEM